MASSRRMTKAGAAMRIDSASRSTATVTDHVTSSHPSARNKIVQYLMLDMKMSIDDAIEIANLADEVVDWKTGWRRLRKVLKRHFDDVQERQVFEEIKGLCEAQ